MTTDRRSFLKAGCTTGVVLLAGCLEDDEEGEVNRPNSDTVVTGPSSDEEWNGHNDQEIDIGDDDDDTGGETVQENVQENPDPEVIVTSFPEPQVVSTDSDHRGGDSYEFFVTVQNTGEAGDIFIELQFPTEQGLMNSARTIERYYDAGERREESVTAELPDHTDRFDFKLAASVITATVENDGGDGTVAVELYNPGSGEDMVINRTTVEMASNETRDVRMDIDNSVLFGEDTEIRALHFG